MGLWGLISCRRWLAVGCRLRWWVDGLGGVWRLGNLGDGVLWALAFGMMHLIGVAVTRRACLPKGFKFAMKG
jgi:hypothetical protein